jgi:hypothetical protein
MEKKCKGLSKGQCKFAKGLVGAVDGLMDTKNVRASARAKAYGARWKGRVAKYRSKWKR